MNRRKFIVGLGSAAAWPVVAQAQPALPVVGFLISGSAEGYADIVAAVRQGLGEAGYIEGRNVSIEYRYANEQFDRLPALAADLVQRKVAVIYTSGGPLPALAAKRATATIPIVFANGSDPVKLGLVASLSRPGGNATGMSIFSTELAPKKLELIREMLPTATAIAFLVNPNNPNAKPSAEDMQTAARLIGVKLLVATAVNEFDLDAAFAITVQQAQALIVGVDPLFVDRAAELIALAARHAVPTMFGARNQAEAGGLIAYGSAGSDMFRKAGVYIGRILKGEKPADLPVQQPTKFEMAINLKTAKALGITIPPSVLIRADEVIE
jgi:putative tryptophan/tyrosine transport system substrate-binding protein